jgi:ActR/RegA family two-component response regulator
MTKILVIEDDIILAKSLQRGLEKRGFVVHAVYNLIENTFRYTKNNIESWVQIQKRLML